MTYHPPHISRLETEVRGGPEAGLTVAPRSVNDVAMVLRYASERDRVVQVWGGGTHSGYGRAPRPDLVMSMERLGELEKWEPDDLTIVVGAGAPIDTVESLLAERHQSLIMPERPGRATIGGVVAAGVSGLRRGRMYGVRERVLELTAVTGDGRVVRSGGRVVKNVSGYDLHRLSVGAFGSLGVIVSVCLKLWPTPPASATVTIEDLDSAGVVTRPLAVLEQNDSIRVFLWGTDAEVAAQALRLGGSLAPGLHWPDDPEGAWEWSVRVPPARTSEAISQLPADWRFLAVHGVGEIRAASDSAEGLLDLRFWAKAVGGHVVVTKGMSEDVDPWGMVPPGLDLQRRLISEFDPRRVINPGRLPGGL